MGWTSSQLARRLEKWLQRIPTWLAVLVSVLCLAALALWIQGDVSIDSPEDLLTRDVLRIFFENAESFAIVAAVILYFKGAPDRKAQKHYDAWRVIENAAAAGLSTSYGRFRAIEDLHKDGMPLRSLEAPNANLMQIQLAYAQLVEAYLDRADLREANLREANLQNAQLSGADLRGVDLRGANLQGANLQQVNLEDANLTGANLQGVDLQGASLRSAELWRAKFLGANLAEAELKWAELQGSELNGARLSNTVMPDGSVQEQATEYWLTPP